MEFLASLAIKALIGTSICGTITVGTIYKCDKTLLGFKDDSQHLPENSGTNGGDKVSTPLTGTDNRNESSNVQDPKKDGNTNTEGVEVSVKVIANKNPAENTDNSSGAEGQKNKISQVVEPAAPLVDGTGIATKEEAAITKVVDSTVSLPGSSSPKIEPTTPVGEGINVATPDTSTPQTTNANTNALVGAGVQEPI